MIILGMLLASIILLLSFTIIGPYGIVIFLILIFGLVFSTYHKNQQIYEDIKIIREKLGLLRDEEKEELEIKKSEEEYMNANKNPEFISELDQEIEEELKKYIEENPDSKDK
ncbi:hypothetical protein J2T13_005383 [Paenibacillus sp. DS2015]|uniref:hypothetical protein n=1 Tax=Paenibacillus sp. DS2015 TaxID=3373917 RepID=UPI003D1B34A6